MTIVAASSIPISQGLSDVKARVGERIEAAFRRVDAMGARRGLKSEQAFRKGMQAVVEKRFGAKVENWTYRDDDRSSSATPPT